MKYLLHFKQTDGYIIESLNKKTVDYNKIYSLEYNNEIMTIGKIFDNPGRGIRDVGCIIIGYTPDGKETHDLIKYGTWKWIREATPDEINLYDLYSSSNKYNL